MKVVKIIYFVCLIFFVAVCGLGIYYKFVEDEIFAMQTTHMGSVLKSENYENKDNRFIFDFKYYANKDGTGVEMLELQMTCFTGVNLDSTYGYGVQIINPSKMVLNEELVDLVITHPWLIGTSRDFYISLNTDYSSCEVKYYNTDDFVSFGATTKLNENEHPYVITIDGKAYAFDFEYDNKVYGGELFLGSTHMHYCSSFDYFMYKSYNAISNITSGTGVYENLTAEYSDVFNIYSYNTTTKKFDMLSNYKYKSEYLDLKVTYIERGARVHADSMFNRIGNLNKRGDLWIN